MRKRIYFAVILHSMVSSKSLSKQEIDVQVKNLFNAATTMAEGHKAMKGRIEMLVKHPKRNVVLLW